MYSTYLIFVDEPRESSTGEGRRSGAGEVDCVAHSKVITYITLNGGLLIRYLYKNIYIHHQTCTLAPREEQGGDSSAVAIALQGHSQAKQNKLVHCFNYNTLRLHYSALLFGIQSK